MNQTKTINLPTPKNNQGFIVGWFKRFIARSASEAYINRLSDYEPGKLSALASCVSNPPRDWPWDDPEESAEFWKTYRSMIKVGRRGIYIQ